MYAKDWAQSVVEDWCKLSTRVQLLSQHYETTLAIFYPNIALPTSHTLKQDLIILLARSKGEQDAAALWKWFKRYAKDISRALTSYDQAKTALKYAQIRCIAIKGLKCYAQLRLF
jgi:hypothetical protein